jgi:2,4-dienoyl-CoA reductase-like NADH-dependent reductase (Old Yellow Enzyme family)/thioredoxin reductase
MDRTLLEKATGLAMALPGQIGGVALKNRLVLAPMGTNFGTTDGFCTDRDKQYYVERAKGGVAMVMTEAMVVTEGARNHRNSLCVFHDRYIPGLAGLVEAVKKHDCAVFGQISHRGGLLRRDVLNMEPVGPSPWRNPNTGDEVRALTIAEMHAIQRDFVAAVKRMAKAGYDGVELHGANGYLFHQFFTPRVNRRTDQYGGSVENRARMLTETVRRIRDALPDFPLLVRISATEYIPEGYSTEDVVELATILEREGVSSIDLSGGTNESPELSRFCIQPPSMPRGCLEEYAGPITEAVGIPTIIAGRIIEPREAEGILRNKSADFISLGRALFSDPYWPQKALGTMAAPIRQCISCNVCFERLTLELDVNCVQNPLLGTEFEDPHLFEPSLVARAEQKRRVLVVGGGVAGIEAARFAAGRGHDVEIWEERAAAGGQVPLALAAPDKEEIAPLWTTRVESLPDFGIRLKTSKPATSAAIKAYGADHVLVATGSRQRDVLLNDAAGKPTVPTLGAWDVLARPEMIPDGASVTIVGGGMVGIETADLLITRGCRITVVEMMRSIAPAMARNNRTDILLRLKAAGTVIHLNARITAVDANSIHLKRGEEAVAIPRDPYLVAAIGPVANRDLVPELEKLGTPFTLIGDAAKPGDFLGAIRDGWMAGMAI